MESLYSLCLFLLFRAIEKGGLRSILSCIGTIAAFPLSWKISDSLALQWGILKNANQIPLFQDTLDQVYALANHILWFVLVFLCCKLILFVVDHILKSIQHVPVYHAFSCLSGVLFGVIESFIWLLVLCVILQSPLFYNGKEAIEQSVLGTIEEIGEDVSIAFMQPVQQTNTWSNLTDQIDALQKWMQEKNNVFN